MNYMPRTLTRTIMTEPVSTTVAGGYGLAKLLGAGAALTAALIIAFTRPPANRRELFVRAFVAIASSLIFGGFVVQLLDYYVPFVSVGAVQFSEFHAAVHGLVGAISWGVWGGIATLMEHLKTKPIEFLASIKSLLPFK